MKNKTKERSRKLASTLTLKESPVDDMEGFGRGGGGGGASGLGVTQGRDKNKEEYKPDRMATKAEMKELGNTSKPEMSKFEGRRIKAEKEFVNDLVEFDLSGTKMGERYKETLKHLKNLKGKSNFPLRGHKVVGTDSRTGYGFERLSKTGEAPTTKSIRTRSRYKYGEGEPWDRGDY